MNISRKLKVLMLRTCSGQLVSLLMCVMGRERCSWGLWGPLGSLVAWWRWPHGAGSSRVVLGLQCRVPASAHFQVISPVPLWLFPQATEMIFTLGETWWWKKKTHQKARKILKPSLSETFHFFIFFFPPRPPQIHSYIHFWNICIQKLCFNSALSSCLLCANHLLLNMWR